MDVSGHDHDSDARAQGKPQPRAGLTLGPVTFVPELRVAGADDPWAHRKGEPRIFALLWAMYLLASAIVTVFSVRALGYPRAGQFVFGGLSMLTLAMVGIMLLWPALRLSQVRPELPTTAVIFDLAVVLLPVHAIVWPMSMLTGWPWPVTVGILFVITGWGLVAAGVVALTMRPGPSAGSSAARMLAMLLLMVLCLGGPAFRVLSMRAGQPLAGDIDLFSPLSAPWVLGLAAEGQRPDMALTEWVSGAIPAVIGLILLVGCGVMNRWRRRSALPTPH